MCVWRANADEWRLVFTRSRDNKWLIWIQDFCFRLWTIRKLLDRLLLGLQSVCNPSKIPESLQNNPTLYEVLNQSNISQNQQQWPASLKPARKLSETIVTAQSPTTSQYLINNVQQYLLTTSNYKQWSNQSTSSPTSSSLTPKSTSEPKLQAYGQSEQAALKHGSAFLWQCYNRKRVVKAKGGALRTHRTKASRVLVGRLVWWETSGTVIHILVDKLKEELEF